MVDGGTVVVAIHALLRRRRVVVWVCGEDDIPTAVDVVYLGRPDVGRVGFAGRWEEEEFRLGSVPVSIRHQQGRTTRSASRWVHINQDIRERLCPEESNVVV